MSNLKEAKMRYTEAYVQWLLSRVSDQGVALQLKEAVEDYGTAISDLKDALADLENNDE